MERAHIRPFREAAHIVDLMAENWKQLLVPFAIPEILRVVLYLSNGFLISWPGSGAPLPVWLSIVLRSILAAMTIVPVILLIAGRIRPQALPLRIMLPVTTVAATLIITNLVLNILTNNKLILQLLAPLAHLTAMDDAKLSLLNLGLWLWAYVVYVVLTALIYPLLGIIAMRGTLDLKRFSRWLRRHTLGFLGLAAILIAAATAFTYIYWWLVGRALGDLVPAPGQWPSMPEKLKVFAVPLLSVPVDFVVVVTAGVAIGAVYNVITSHEADP